MDKQWTLELMREFSESKGRTGLSHPTRVYSPVVWQGVGGVYFTFRSEKGYSEVRQFDVVTGESVTSCTFRHECPNVQDNVVQAIAQALAQTEPIQPEPMQAHESEDDSGVDTQLWED